MKILCPAKINLFLFVIKRREDGYHDIFSLVDKVSLFDEIYVERGSGRVYFLNDDIPAEDNTISRTLYFLGQFFDVKFDFFVNKGIPKGSGLGGASSDAAGIIKFFLKMKKIDKKIAYLVAEKVSSDSTLFLENSPLIIFSKGEKFSTLEIDGKRFYLIIYPKFISHTKLVYELWDKISEERKDFPHFFPKRLKFWKIPFYNDLENPFLQMYKNIEYFYQYLKSLKITFFITGSGSSFVIPTKSEREAENILKKMNFDFDFFIVSPLK